MFVKLGCDISKTIIGHAFVTDIKGVSIGSSSGKRGLGLIVSISMQFQSFCFFFFFRMSTVFDMKGYSIVRISITLDRS